MTSRSKSLWKILVEWWEKTAQISLGVNGKEVRKLRQHIFSHMALKGRCETEQQVENSMCPKEVCFFPKMRRTREEFCKVP